MREEKLEGCFFPSKNNFAICHLILAASEEQTTAGNVQGHRKLFNDETLLKCEPANDCGSVVSKSDEDLPFAS